MPVQKKSGNLLKPPHICMYVYIYIYIYIYICNNFFSIVSSSLIHMALCHILAKNLVNFKMFSDESNELKTYRYVRMK